MTVVCHLLISIYFFKFSILTTKTFYLLNQKKKKKRFRKMFNFGCRHVDVNASLCFDHCIKAAACSESNYLGC